MVSVQTNWGRERLRLRLLECLGLFCLYMNVFIPINNIFIRHSGLKDSPTLPLLAHRHGRLRNKPGREN